MTAFLLKGSTSTTMLVISLKDGRPLEIEDDEWLSIFIEDMGQKGLSLATLLDVLEDIGYLVEDNDSEANIFEWKGSL